MTEKSKKSNRDTCIKLSNVSLQLKERLILDGINLEVKNKEFVCIIGPSGSGKTTILNLVAGLIQRPTNGEVVINGHAPSLGSRDVAYMMARDCMVPWRSAIENAALGLEVRGVNRGARMKRAGALLGAVGLGVVKDALPKELSHGMRQRCALARTFALDSEVMLMDEPFGALDAQTKLQLEELLVELWQVEQRTVVFITHDIAEAIALGDRVIVLSSGPARIVEDKEIDLDRPRSVRNLQGSAKFHEIYTSVWATLEAGWRK